MEASRHYACQVRLDGDVVFVVWYSGKRDGFLGDAGGRLLTARTPEALATAAQAQGVRLEDAEPTDYDFDRIRAWCAVPNAANVDRRVFPEPISGLKCAIISASTTPLSYPPLMARIV
jgi:hypothetical protein